VASILNHIPTYYKPGTLIITTMDWISFIMLASYILDDLFIVCSQTKKVIWNILSLMCFIQAVLDQDPAYVIRRFESGKYAVDADVRSIYLEVNNPFILHSSFLFFLHSSGCRHDEHSE